MAIELTKVAYTESATAKGGRAGHVTSSDGLIDFDLGQPGSGAEHKVNPETLFAAGYASCFQGALANRAKTQGFDTSDSTVTAEVSFGPSEDGGFGIAVTLKVNIPGVEDEKAQELVELAHQFCPYSKATRGNINVTLEVV
ncbi:Ohr subfamily peroxiredoxin [Jatrophihabitans sp. GAS493]|uniref:organic hydroperoxide resistance protein n=1 Tax=Jatrophihabitans sp. GAS493 TaxID=1907575 RepID=UPI000BB74E04|nr:organic hydroperoxide resistance protein [Jatrophihabitans sp. GAS493]SOD70797.1 Ohr subfamily peroxiredoxin [Jatrophihabitans sp. GAS493]